MASAPAAAASPASSALVTVTHASLPAFWMLVTSSRGGQPKVNETTAGRSAAKSSSFAFQSSSSWRGSATGAPARSAVRRRRSTKGS